MEKINLLALSAFNKKIILNELGAPKLLLYCRRDVGYYDNNGRFYTKEQAAKYDELREFSNDVMYNAVREFVNTLKYVYGYKIIDICNMIDISRNTFNCWLTKRQMIKSQLQRRLFFEYMEMFIFKKRFNNK